MSKIPRNVQHYKSTTEGVVCCIVSNDRSTPNNVPIRSEFSRILSKCEEVLRIQRGFYITNCRQIVQQKSLSHTLVVQNAVCETFFFLQSVVGL